MAAIINNIEMLGISKRFGSLVSLEDVDITIKPGRIHALLGQGEAGKTTLMKILAGIYKPDAGSMRIDKEIYKPSNPNVARKKGIFITLPLIEELTVSENIF